MRQILVEEYKGYTVALNSVPTNDGKFAAAFSIHKDTGREHQLRRSTVKESDMVYQSSASTAVRFSTDNEAYASARSQAFAWIDAASATGYEIRAVNDLTVGDFLSFEMFVGNRWREIRISATALAVLDKGGNSPQLDVFEQHLSAILLAAAQKALASPDAPFVLLNDPL